MTVPQKTSGKSTSASGTTSFSSSFRNIIGPIAFSLVVTVLKSPTYVVVVPYLVMMAKFFVKTEPGETSLQFWTKFAVMQAVYGGTILTVAVVALLPVFGPTLTGYHTLFLYLPMSVISLHDRRYQYGLFGTAVMRYLFDAPLVAAGYISREIFGLRLLAPFCNIFDDDIVQGSMPFPSDIATLAAEPYNVGMVVNMCREYKGATRAMEEHGIVQCHLPHQDTTAVTYESLLEGCSAIRAYRAKHPDKRVYVHCKGGIGRASTMTLAHYIVNGGEDPAVALNRMKSQRHVVYLGIAKYPGIVRLNEERLAKQR